MLRTTLASFLPHEQAGNDARFPSSYGKEALDDVSTGHRRPSATDGMQSGRRVLRAPTHSRLRVASDCNRSINGGNPPPRGPGPHGSRDATEPPLYDCDSPECRRDSGRSPRTAQQSRFGLVILSLFILVQAIDGAFTYFAVLRFGPVVEGNPLVASLIYGLGQGPGLVSAKLFAGILGTLLYVTSVYHILAPLVFLYLATAILPWAATF